MLPPLRSGLAQHFVNLLLKKDQITAKEYTKESKYPRDFFSDASFGLA
jgi:hypothetical protein